MREAINSVIMLFKAKAQFSPMLALKKQVVVVWAALGGKPHGKELVQFLPTASKKLRPSVFKEPGAANNHVNVKADPPLVKSGGNTVAL